MDCSLFVNKIFNPRSVVILYRLEIFFYLLNKFSNLHSMLGDLVVHFLVCKGVDPSVASCLSPHLYHV